jgi:hypothetical protein
LDNVSCTFRILALDPVFILSPTLTFNIYVNLCHTFCTPFSSFASLGHLYLCCTCKVGKILNKTMYAKCSVNCRHYTENLFTSLFLRIPMSNVLSKVEIS